MPKNLPREKVPKVVVIGGGTGSFVVLSGLKKYPIELTALITMMDSGGSTGRLRDQLGVLPPGDLRQALVALSESTQLWRDLFSYRFTAGDLEGHNFGNIFLSAFEKITGSIEHGIERAADVLQVKGQVIPITTEKAHLCVRLEDGEVIEGEAFIDMDERDRPRIVESFLAPKAHANPQALKAIANADFIIVGPGDLYTSLIPNFVVEGVSTAIKNSKAKKIYILNLMTKKGQTRQYTASDHLNEIVRHTAGTKFDYVLVNDAKPSKEALSWYKKYGVDLVSDDLGQNKSIVRADLVSSVDYKPVAGDKLSRSLLRHDSDKLATVIYEQIITKISD